MFPVSRFHELPGVLKSGLHSRGSFLRLGVASRGQPAKDRPTTSLDRRLRCVPPEGKATVRSCRQRPQCAKIVPAVSDVAKT